MTESQLDPEQIARAWMKQAASASRPLTRKDALAGARGYIILCEAKQLRPLGQLAFLPGYLRDAFRAFVKVAPQRVGPENAKLRFHILGALDERDNRATQSRPKSGGRLFPLKPGPIPRGFALKGDWRKISAKSKS